MSLTTVTDTEALLRRIIASYTFNSDQMKLTRTEPTGAVYWVLQAHIDDLGMVIGKKGAHAKALKFLLAEMGIAQELHFALRIEDEPIGRFRSPTRPIPPAPLDYDTTEPRELLQDILEAIVGPETVKVTASRFQAGHLFAIEPATHDILSRLTDHYDEDPERQTVLESLRTLFKAYAHCQGTDFALKVKE